ncbi:MAG: phosphoribosylglycinamide formyltransferase [Fastidiosipilaceae bacterium]|jgi:phosphoribosylglycinamide formyltransferase-1
MNVAVFVSGGGTNLQCLIDRQKGGLLPNCEIVRVIASKEGTRAEERARKTGISTTVVRRRDFKTETAYDQALLDSLAGYGVDLIVLAGFLTKLGAGFVKRYPNQIINVHPSLLPAFGGAGYYGIKPHQAVLEYGCKVTGATVHLVDNNYDTGPIVLQKAIEVCADDTAETLQLRVMRECEQVILPEAVRLFTAGKIAVSGRITRIVEEQVFE